LDLRIFRRHGERARYVASRYPVGAQVKKGTECGTVLRHGTHDNGVGGILLIHWDDNTVTIETALTITAR